MQDINLKDVSYCYPNGFCAVDNINIEIGKGENVVIVGQNGAGKTTTVKMMNGLLKPSSGNVLVGNKNTKDYTTAQISRHVGYVFQSPDDQIFHSTVELEIRYGPATMGLSKEIENQRVERALQMTGLTKHRDENPYNLPLSIRKFVAIASDKLLISLVSYAASLTASLAFLNNSVMIVRTPLRSFGGLFSFAKVKILALIFDLRGEVSTLPHR